MRHGGFLCDAELFEHGFFGISAAEAAAMDPQQRMLLEQGYGALHSSGRDRAAVGGTMGGVYLGCGSNEYMGMLMFHSPVGASVYAATAGALAVASGRLSYVLGMHGPCQSSSALKFYTEVERPAGHIDATPLQ